MENRDVAAALEGMATLLELKGENAFRCRAYANAARQIAALGRPVADLVERGELTEIRGIGRGLAEEVAELVRTGRLEAYEALLAATPPGLLEMLEVPGLGPKRVKAISEALEVYDLDALAAACAAGQVERLSGFGKKTVERMLKGVAFLKQHRGRFLCSTAFFEAEGIREFLKAQPGAIRVEVTGSVRRCLETSGDVDLIASASDPAGLAEAFVGYGGIAEVTEKGKAEVRAVLKSGMRADLRMVDDREFPYALHCYTGSREHVEQMRRRAGEQGMALGAHGLFRAGQPVPCRDEAEVFAALGLAYIPPELREARGEIAQAEAGPLPALVSEADLRGTLHVHTAFSDGRASVEMVARTAAEMGYRYVGICDHSRGAAYANGLTEDRVRAQWKEIDRVNATLAGVRVLKGIEVDILKDGRLDFEDKFLAAFDIVVASVHSRFGMSEAEATERLVRAVQNPCVDILGHPTGRLLLSREGYPVDLCAVIDAAAEAGTAIELNADPHRLDLDWRYLGHARNRGAKIAINTDAHGIEGLRHVRFGVGIARKGGLTPGDVLNAMELGDLLKHLGRSR